MRIVIRADEHLGRFGNMLQGFGAGEANRLMAMALNTEGNKGRTRVRRALMEQTGIRSHQIGKAVRTIKASPGALRYTLEARGDETNISMFGLKVQWRRVSNVATRQRMKLQWVSSSPWNQGPEFPGAFSIKRYGKRVFIRTGNDGARFPIRPVYGPNLAREIVKAESRAQFETIAPRVAVEVGRLIGLVLGGQMSLGRRGFTGS